MKYNPEIHHRRSIRLKGYDYSQAGAYFITICCKDMKGSFGKIENDEIILNEFGKIAFDGWMKLPARYANFELDVFQIMPNHLHGIVVLNSVGGWLAPARFSRLQPHLEKFQSGQPQGFAPTVGDIIGAYKSLVANECLDIFKSKNEIMGKLWQRNFYEHIIRNEKSYKNISDYIVNNPDNWRDDKFYKGIKLPLG